MTEREPPLTKIVRPLRSGQITIPAEFRQKLGIGLDSLLQVTLMQGELRVRPLSVSERAAGSPWLEELYDAFSSVREEAGSKRYTAEEINAAIDAAVQAVRQKHA